LRNGVPASFPPTFPSPMNPSFTLCPPPGRCPASSPHEALRTRPEPTFPASAPVAPGSSSGVRRDAAATDAVRLVLPAALRSGIPDGEQAGFDAQDMSLGCDGDARPAWLRPGDGWQLSGRFCGTVRALSTACAISRHARFTRRDRRSGIRSGCAGGCAVGARGGADGSGPDPRGQDQARPTLTPEGCVASQGSNG
jgi:hypothetical protein